MLCDSSEGYTRHGVCQGSGSALFMKSNVRSRKGKKEGASLLRQASISRDAADLTTEMHHRGALGTFCSKQSTTRSGTRFDLCQANDLHLTRDMSFLKKKTELNYERALGTRPCQGLRPSATLTLSRVRCVTKSDQDLGLSGRSWKFESLLIRPRNRARSS